MDRERTTDRAENIVARIQHWEEFPGMAALNLNPDDPADKIIADAIGSAHQAARVWSEFFTGSAPFGRLATMLEYEIVDEQAIHRALRNIR